MSKTFLCTGTAGFISYCLAKKLLEQGDTVIGIDNFNDPKNPESKDVYYEEHWVKLRKFSNFIPINENIAEIDEWLINQVCLDNNIEHIDGVFHLAALARIQRAINEPIKAAQSNIMGTLNLLEICRKLHIPKFVFSSSSNVYGEQEDGGHTEEKSLNAQNPYAIHKMTGEYFCKFYHKQYGIKTIMLRYFNVIGPEQNPKGEYALLVPKFCLRALRNELLTIYGDGTKTRAFVNVSDVVNANLMAMETMNVDCFGEAFNICGEKSYSVNEITQKIIDLTNSTSEVQYLEDKPGETWYVFTNSDKAESMFWKREKDIDETLKECVMFFKKKYIDNVI